MRKKMKEVVMRWRDKQEGDTQVEFNHTKKGEGKSFKARIINNDTGKPIVELISYEGYNEKYVKHQLSHYFNLLNTALQVGVGSGDKILTRYRDAVPPAVGTVVDLPAETYYYAVNNGMIYCNGEQLGRQWRATYLGSVTMKKGTWLEPLITPQLLAVRRKEAMQKLSQDQQMQKRIARLATSIMKQSKKQLQ